MKQPNVISPQAELLLTSAGLTTEAMQERLHEMAHATGRSALTVLRLSDGWQRIEPAGQSDTPAHRIERIIENVGARLWSRRYLRYCLGNKAHIATVTASQLRPPAFERLLNDVDMLMVPGGNTYRTMWGILPHVDAIRRLVGEGMPYISDSAGTIIAGQTVRPASIAPADPMPRAHTPSGEAGLHLISADITVHAPGRTGTFAISGPQAAIASYVLSMNESSQLAISDYTEAHTTPTYTLHDKQALSVSGGTITLLS